MGPEALRDEGDGDPIAAQLVHMGSQFALSRIDRASAYDTCSIFMPLESDAKATPSRKGQQRDV